MLDPREIDYKALGFQAGLEIHHQLKTGRKLFCRCQAELDQELMKSAQYTFNRKFRAVLGEMGDFDPGMLVEVEKDYLVIYHANDDHVCTYEMDETPPFWPDMEAIDIGFHLSCIFDCASPVEELVVNRKQYLDGSITTGFQRTMIIARDGHIQLLNGKKVTITNILVEEDAARKIKTEDRNRTVYYNLDRLGIPLTEIITDHREINSPQELVEVAGMIGLYLRSSGLVRRGIGSVRQDVNISIDGGSRVEIKGIQDLSLLPKWCAHEVVRQHSLIEVQDVLKDLPVMKDDFKHTYIEITHLFRDLGEGESAFAVRLPSMKNVLSKEIQPGRDFGFEIFDKCSLITGIQCNEMFHSGETREDSIRRKNFPDELFVDGHRDSMIRDLLKLNDEDGYIAARGPTNRVLHTMKKTIERVKQAFDGVPQETRRALPDGNNEFLRVIHGKERLYPDTDTPPIEYPRDKMESIRKSIKKNPVELMEQYTDQGITFEQLSDLIRHGRTDLFERMVIDQGISGKLAYRLLFEVPRYLSRKGLDGHSITEDAMVDLGVSVEKNRISRSAVTPLMVELCKEKGPKAQLDILEKAKNDYLSDDEIHPLVKKRIGSIKKAGKALSKDQIVGLIMKEHDHRLNGASVASIVEEYL